MYAEGLPQSIAAALLGISGLSRFSLHVPLPFDGAISLVAT